MLFLMPLLDMIESDEDKLRFETFYNTYKDYVMYICMIRLKNNKALAEESCQDTFFYLAKNFDKIKEIDSKETKGYVYTVANGLAINKFNKEISGKNEIQENETIMQISDNFFDIYSVTDLKNAVEGLTEEEKTYFRLKYLYGLQLKEIGETFGESTSTVSRKLQKIRAKLKERLGDNNE